VGIALLLLHRTAGSLCRLGAYSKAAVFLCSYRRLASRAHSPPRVSKHDLQRIGRLDIHRTSRARMGRGTVCAMEESVVATLHHAGVRLRYLGDGLGENLGVDDRCELAEHRDGTSSARCAACVSVTPTPPTLPCAQAEKAVDRPFLDQESGPAGCGAREPFAWGAREPKSMLGDVTFDPALAKCAFYPSWAESAFYPSTSGRSPPADLCGLGKASSATLNALEKACSHCRLIVGFNTFTRPV